jgi:lysophospholipase L1-like esterase
MLPFSNVIILEKQHIKFFHIQRRRFILETNKQKPTDGNWIGSWYASQTFYDEKFAKKQFENQTIRMIVHPHAFGSKIRLKFSNLYGIEPVTFGKVTTALARKDGQTVSGTNRHVTLNGQLNISIPAGKEIYTDPIDLPLNEQSDVAISVYILKSAQTSTWHFSPPQSTYVSEGDHTDDTNADSFRMKIHSYYWLSGMDVLIKNQQSRVIVALGDSITEGSTSSQNANQRWPDLFWERLNRENFSHSISVINAGNVGNQILKSGHEVGIPLGGESLLSRLDRDVFSHSGVTDVILLGGINDIGLGNSTAEHIIAGLKEIAAKVHGEGLRIFVGTLLPFGGAPTYSDEKELIRQEVNGWIQTNEVFDGIIDFNSALADPQNPKQLLPSYDFGDHLHPSDAGFIALANCIPLSLFINKI